MFQYIQKSLVLIAALSLLSACQGKNPFDRSNDPTKDYGNIEQSAQDYQNLENTALENYKDQILPELERAKYENAELKNQLAVEAAKKANSQSTCGRVYDMEVVGTEGRRLDFIENTPKNYKVKVRSYLTDNFSLQIENAPENSMKLTQSSTPGEWDLSWQPSSSLIGDRQVFYTGSVKLAFKGQPKTEAAQRCFTSAFTEDFGVTVAIDQAQPVLTIEDVSGKNFQSKEEQGLIQLTVNDPASTPDLPPLVSQVEIEGSLAGRTELGARCFTPKASPVEKTWTVDCVVFFNSLKKEIAAKENGVTLTGVVAFKAVSQRTGRRTPAVPREVKITINEDSKVLPLVDPNQRPTTGIAPIPTARPSGN
jgi:hypothetical protein